MVNKVILIGNLGRDPEVRHLESGVAVAKFSIATNESFRDKNGDWHDRTEWHDIVMWRFLAERAEKSLKKGTMIYVEGKLTHRKWQDKEGNDRYTTEVVANTFRMLSKREQAAEGTYQDNFPETKDAPGINPGKPDIGQDQSTEEDDLPF